MARSNLSSFKKYRDSKSRLEHTTRSNQSGTDVMIFEIFLPKKLAFSLITKLNYAKILITTLVFEKTPIFSPKTGKNRRKL
jgi:hypothetical protein